MATIPLIELTEHFEVGRGDARTRPISVNAAYVQFVRPDDDNPDHRTAICMHEACLVVDGAYKDIVARLRFASA